MRKAVEIPVYATVKLRSANSRTASTCSRFTPGNHRRKSSTPAPSSRFSKRAFTGTRVPLNSHTPLTFPGTRNGVIRAGVRTDSMIGRRTFRREISLGLAAPDHTVPTVLARDLSQALRAGLQSGTRWQTFRDNI